VVLRVTNIVVLYYGYVILSSVNIIRMHLLVQIMFHATYSLL